jgi:hypothetical protein
MKNKSKILNDKEREEIEQQRLSAMSMATGLSIDELASKFSVTEQQDTKSRCSEKDCESKRIILGALSSPMTSTELWHRIQGQYSAKYKTFTGTLSRYQKYQYIEKCSYDKPYIYRLTAWGVENAKNPHLVRQNQIKKFKNKTLEAIYQLLADNPELLQAMVQQLSGIHINNGFSSVGSSYTGNTGNTKSCNDIGDSSHQYDELLKKIQELKQEKDALSDKLEIAQNKPATMIVGQSYTAQPQPDIKKNDGRSFDGLLRGIKDKRMDEANYKRLPKNLIKFTAIPQGQGSTINMINFVTRKGVGCMYSVASDRVTEYTELGFARGLTKDEIESLECKWINGDVCLVDKKGNKYKITTVPKSRPQQQTGIQRVRINAVN